MKFFGKRKCACFLLAVSLMVLTLAGCGKAPAKSGGEEQSSQASGSWLEEEAKDRASGEDSKKEEPETDSGTEARKDTYVDVDSVEEEEIDYSKYEEKKEERAKNGTENENVTYSDGTGNGQDAYQTDPVPEGKQNPVDQQEEVDTSKELTCYLSISCGTILDNLGELTEGKEELVPQDGMIYARREVVFYEGETVFDVLLRETRNHRIHMEYSFNPIFNSNYIEAINNLYEFDCGNESGWMYNVNGWYPNYGCSRYLVQEGDEIQWNYTCDLGRDLGTSWMEQNGEG